MDDGKVNASAIAHAQRASRRRSTTRSRDLVRRDPDRSAGCAPRLLPPTVLDRGRDAINRHARSARRWPSAPDLPHARGVAARDIVRRPGISLCGRHPPGREGPFKLGLNEVRIGSPCPFAMSGSPPAHACPLRPRRGDRRRCSIRSRPGRPACSTPSFHPRPWPTRSGGVLDDASPTSTAGESPSWPDWSRGAAGGDRHRAAPRGRWVKAALGPTPTRGERPSGLTGPRRSEPHGPEHEAALDVVRRTSVPIHDVGTAIYLSPDVFGWAGRVGLVQSVRLLLRRAGRHARRGQPRRGHLRLRLVRARRGEGHVRRRASRSPARARRPRAWPRRTRCGGASTSPASRGSRTTSR